ncbi:MAG: glutamine--scyllo-inositol transaminase [Bacteroidetes bacterium OLB9]|nr:MAG: glutamine--scyllo-inositol transaminase [Bacteroidetes bacterium OLB9]MCZ2340015.1 LegC family aminotransferase [Chitinophagales bacterium]
MIPLSVPQIGGNEWKYVKDCLDTGWISSVGSYVSQFEQMVADFAGCRYGVACMNGTAGLHIAQILSDIQPGDHVIVPNITFIATLNAITYTGAEPILIDADPNNWQMDLDILEDFLDKNTYLVESGIGDRVSINYHSILTHRPIKAIMPVHVLGNVGDMDRLMSIATKYHLTIIEDSTESLGSYYKGKHTGSFGQFGVFSFNGNKIISTGGGGVIVTDDEDLARKAKHLTTQAKASSIEYIHDEIGYNYRLVNILAAVGVAQMEQFPQFLENKHRMDKFYRTELEGVGDIAFQKVRPDVDPNCWLFTFKTARMRDLLDYLNKKEIFSRPFWMPMNQLRMFKKLLYVNKEDHSTKLYESCISIPSSVGITLEQQETVVKEIKHFFGS